MTREEILSMACDAGIEFHYRKQQARIGIDVLTGCDSTGKLAKFAELVSIRAVAVEREECAALCEKLPAQDSCSGVERSLWDVATMACADAIRARGSQ